MFSINRASSPLSGLVESYGWPVCELGNKPLNYCVVHYNPTFMEISWTEWSFWLPTLSIKYWCLFWLVYTFGQNIFCYDNTPPDIIVPQGVSICSSGPGNVIGALTVWAGSKNSLLYHSHRRTLSSICDSSSSAVLGVVIWIAESQMVVLRSVTVSTTGPIKERQQVIVTDRTSNTDHRFTQEMSHPSTSSTMRTM